VRRRGCQLMAEREHPGHCGFVGNGQSFRILAVRFLQQVIRTSDYQTVLTIRLATVVIWGPKDQADQRAGHGTEESGQAHAGDTL
jgi:hypothetical protein